MALLNPTFIFGIVVLTYLSTFVFFAILRILTGISIQRVGYFSLRRLAYTPKDGIKVEIRGLGLNLHRPTFAQPTWLSIVLTELAVTVDLKEIDRKKGGVVDEGDGETEDEDSEHDEKDIKNGQRGKLQKQISRTTDPGEQERSRSWQQLTRIKNKIKRLHRKINYIRLVDIVATNTTVTVAGVGQIQVGHLTGAVDTRRKMIDRGRMFSHLKTAKKGQQPAEWIFTVRSVLFTADGRESLEILDHATLNIHGLLYDELDGLRDAAIGLKLGRVHIPYDDFETCVRRFKNIRRQFSRPQPRHVDISVTDLLEELDHPEASREDAITQTVSDSKEFASSILRGIKEVQFAVSYVGFTKKIEEVRPRGTPMYLNASMKEVGVDLHRLDQKSPAHRMYFASKDVAHQALLAALSIAVGVDDGHGHESYERLIYIPMATTTARTTLPAKTIQVPHDNSADERNANILFANMVVTSPSIDLDPKHLPLLLALTQPNPKLSRKSTPRKHILISRLLPRANIKFSMHEPVIRVALPAVEKNAEEDDFDLIISSISSVSLDIESSHSATGSLHYGLVSTFRVLSHDLYYQTASGAHFDLLQTESLELKVQVSANPEVNVVATGNLQTFSIHMIRPEISDGVRQIVRQLRLNVEPTKKSRPKTSRDPNFVRGLPPWLLHFHFQASNFSAEVAGVDDEISDDTRGVALNLETWTAEYRAQKIETGERRFTRRRTASRSSMTPDAEMLLKMPSSPRKRNQQHPTDGRKFAMHVRGLEAFVVESTEKWEPEPFISMPRCEVALTTSSDNQGPIFHVNSHVRTLLVQYSLYRHYAVGIATGVLRRAFVRTRADIDETNQAKQKLQQTDDGHLLSPLRSPEDFYTKDAPDYPFTSQELITMDFKSALVQIKINMPADPHVLIHIYGVESGRHRWSPPFLHAKLCRFYAEAPKVKRVWARVLSIKNLRADLREHRRKHASTGEIVDERMIDLYSDAIRFAVPHQLVMHKVFDNFVNTAKSVQQLHHRFVTGTNEYILDKKPEGPKKVPKISLKSRAFLFEIEDGAFEWKLGSIYRAGLIEQAQRIARDAAFKVKAKKIEEQGVRKDSGKYRNRSAMARGRPKDAETNVARSKSVDVNLGEGLHSRAHRGRKMRYDPEGSTGMSAGAKISIAEAEEKLKRHNAQSWRKRIDKVLHQSREQVREMRSIFWGFDQLPEELEDRETILEAPPRPALMSTLIHDLHLTIDKPTFPMSTLSDFIHKYGKGMPTDTKYSLLIPMHVKLNMGEAKVSLRDYPLPLLHVPAIKPGQSPRLSAWSLSSDFVIAEEYRNSESIRHIKIDVVPPDKIASAGKKKSFAIDVRRTVSPVKTYSDIKIDINTGYPTRITWGASLQPAIQDMMMVIETFSKPQIDPSDRVGFWDKIRLSFHSRLSVAWKGDGDVHLMLKGTRDPYLVTGNGAGFLMCWRNNVRMNLYREEDPRKFMTVDSGEYILAIPDYSHNARLTDGHDYQDDESISSMDSFKRGASFKKVVMKLSENVQWMVGLKFERTLKDGTRTFDFDPHYTVVLKEPQYAKAPTGQAYDAFSGFRSHHIHMSMTLKAPAERDWKPMNTASTKSYNAVHLTPRYFTHFFSWWAMFNGTMSLPIRQGKLWPGIEKSSKKFGRHLATVKYQLLLAPLYLSHIYKHKDAEDYSEDVVSATGLKIRLDSFMLDMHQRREWFNTLDRGRKTQAKTTGMKMHQAQLDLVSADIRAISATIAGTTPADLQRATSAALIQQQEQGAADLSRFEIPDNDLSWIDMDDFVELDWILPAESNPQTKILPLAYAPAFTYFRQTDREDTIAGDPDRTSPWGKEETHFCIMSPDDDPRRVQCHLIQKRLNQLEQQIENHHRDLGDAELRCIKDENNEKLQHDYELMSRHGHVLADKKVFLEAMLKDMSARIEKNIINAVPNPDAAKDERHHKSSTESESATTNQHDDNAAEFISDFSNRFVIHNMHLKWNNLLRNIILRYIHQVSQRRGFVYYLSRKAVTFILDIVEEQNKAKTEKVGKTPSPQSSVSSASPGSPSEEGQEEVQNRINELLADGKKFVNADDPAAREAARRDASDNNDLNMNREFSPQNTYHLRLIAPQIQLQSEKNPKAVVLVTAKGMAAKVIEVMDKERLFDDISGLVQRRFTVEMDSTQFFVTHQKWFSSQLLTMYSGNRYGTPAGSAWPPWVPMEVMFDFHTDIFGFKRIVQKTSASLRYNKYNALRLKYNDEISTESNDKDKQAIESRMDHLSVEFPQIRALCNSSQYYAIYIIVLDLLMYSEPLEKTRTERLEKIMLASDFSDLRGAPQMVIRLQERIRQLEEIKTQFMINSKYLDRQGWQDRLLLDKDLTSCEDELFFMMKAITTSQRKYEGAQSTGLLQWNISADEIVWHLIQDNNEPLMEFQLKKAEYDRTDNSDGSHINVMQVDKLIGLNLLPDAIYPEMFAPYSAPGYGNFVEGGTQKMARVYWYMLEAIAGIPVMDHFEVNLFPLKIQLEHEVGKRLFEYMFPGSDDKNINMSPFLVKNMKPIQDEDEENDGEGVPQLVVPEEESGTRGSLELRLKPTMTSESPYHPSSGKAKAGSMHSSHGSGDGHHYRFFQQSSKSTISSRNGTKTLSKKGSVESLQNSLLNRQGLSRSATNKSLAETTNGDAKSKRFNLHRHSNKMKKETPSDDLTEMMSRASNFMTLAYVKMPSVILCLSYKGKDNRNLVDVHDFVFRLPMIEFRNKTWSNLDLALAVKKEIIRALISHTGAILGNKFSKHRPNTAQQTRLRELATSSQLLAPSSNEASYANSETSSIYGSSPVETRFSERSKSPRRSFASSNRSNGLMRTPSASSSTQSITPAQNKVPSFPSTMAMTPLEKAPKSSSSESQNTSGKDHEEKGGFMVHTFQRLKRRGDRSENATDSDSIKPFDMGDAVAKKAKNIIGKKILGSLT